MIRLNIIKGFIEDDKFIMLVINGHKVYGTYNATGLRSMAQQIEDDTPITITDKKTQIHIPVALNMELSQELFDIANKIDNQ